MNKPKKGYKFCKNCGSEFKMYKTTDKFCFKCLLLLNKSKPYKKNKQIKQRSTKLAKETLKYNKLRKAFLSLSENEFCSVAKIVLKENRVATEVHHKAGRKGKLLCYVPYFLAVSREGHNWIDNNPTEAYKLGFLIKPSTVNLK